LFHNKVTFFYTLSMISKSKDGNTYTGTTCILPFSARNMITEIKETFMFTTHFIVSTWATLINKNQTKNR